MTLKEQLADANAAAARAIEGRDAVIAENIILRKQLGAAYLPEDAMLAQRNIAAAKEYAEKLELEIGMLRAERKWRKAQRKYLKKSRQL